MKRHTGTYVARGSILGREFDLAPQASDPERPRATHPAERIGTLDQDFQPATTAFASLNTGTITFASNVNSK